MGVTGSTWVSTVEGMSASLSLSLAEKREHILTLACVAGVKYFVDVNYNRLPEKMSHQSFMKQLYGNALQLPFTVLNLTHGHCFFFRKTDFCQLSLFTILTTKIDLVSLNVSDLYSMVSACAHPVPSVCSGVSVPRRQYR